MRHSKLIFKKICFTALAIGLILESALSAPSSLAGKKVIFKPPTTPAPRTTVGGATRGGKCGDIASQTNLGITPILPQTHHGLTLAPRPTFLVYFPTSSSKQIFFSIKSEDGEQEYQTYLPTPSETRIVAIQLPNVAPDLIVDKKYKWSLSMVCGLALRPSDPTVGGWVQRIATPQELSAQLKTSNPIAQITLYGEQGIWYDMISSLLALRKPSDNQALNSIWEQLLSEQGLQKLVSNISSV